MALTRDDVRHVARLARLKLDDSELEKAHVELEAILRTMDELALVDVQGVEPTFSPVPLDARLRADELRPSLPHDEALAGAPKPSDGGFAVPRVLEGH